MLRSVLIIDPNVHARKSIMTEGSINFMPDMNIFGIDDILSCLLTIEYRA